MSVEEEIKFHHMGIKVLMESGKYSGSELMERADSALMSALKLVGRRLIEQASDNARFSWWNGSDVSRDVIQKRLYDCTADYHDGLIEGNEPVDKSALVDIILCAAMLYVREVVDDE